MEALALKNESTSLSIEPGDLLEDKYRLERVLGAGAMGRVWLARNIRLDAPVAIKVVERDAHGTDAMTRVVTEARLEARLRHPNIVRVLDCHSSQDLSYVVMELLEGCTLADLMDEGPLPPALAVRLMLPLLDGLGLAHRAGVVHRDIKPENVFLARTGERVCPKLLDFGVAHVADDTNAKKRRLIVGTPGYMAPEQATGDDSDARADIWAVGVVLYEAISGESAFACGSYKAYLRALNERVLPSLPESGAGAELSRIVRRALCHDVEQRFRSTVELAEALRGWLRSRDVCEDLSGDSLPPSWVMPDSIIDRALQRAAARHAAYAERDSLAPTQIDMTARRRDQKSGARQTRQTTATSGMRLASQPRVRRTTDSSTIRTLPRAGFTRRGAWSTYALVAGALLGVSLALLDAQSAALADQRPALHSQPVTPSRSARARSPLSAAGAAALAQRGRPVRVVVATSEPSLSASAEPDDANHPQATVPRKAHKPRLMGAAHANPHQPDAAQARTRPR